VASPRMSPVQRIARRREEDRKASAALRNTSATRDGGCPRSGLGRVGTRMEELVSARFGLAAAPVLVTAIVRGGAAAGNYPAGPITINDSSAPPTALLL
jgi:hypothetical protein